jgi:transposase InsO family protein
MGPIHITKDKYRYVLVCVDYFTSWVEAAPMKSITANEVIEKFFALVISRHGCPTSVVTDQGKQFASKAFEGLCNQFHIRHEQVSAYHPQANGKVERFIGFFKKTLATITKNDQSNWDKLLDNCLLAYRVSLNRMLDETPFYLIYGRDPVLPQDMFSKDKNGRRVTLLEEDSDLVEYKTKLRELLQSAYIKLNDKKANEQAKYKKYYDKLQKHIDFEIGQQVMLFVPATKQGYTTKLLARWEGPYAVVGKLNELNYRISSARKVIVAHVQRLRPYRPWSHRRSN